MTTTTLQPLHPSRTLRFIRDLLNSLVLLGSIVILATLSFEILTDTTPEVQRLYMRSQLWICLIFLLDFFVRLYMSERKWHYMLHNILFLVVSIPYLNITQWLHWEPSAIYYIFKAMPLLRGGYGLAIMVSWVTRSKVTSLLLSYVLTLFAVTYFTSLLFYALEHGTNPNVKAYPDALWWACMNVTTVGSNIYAMTSLGRVLSVVLAASGMMMFPIFTVYITQRFQRQQQPRTKKTSSKA